MKTHFKFPVFIFSLTVFLTILVACNNKPLPKLTPPAVSPFTPRPTTTVPTATPSFVPPVDLSGANPYQGAVIAPDNVGNLQKLNSWGKGRVTWASYSPNGLQVAVLTSPKFYLYQAGSDTEIYTIPAPAEGWFISADISDDGQWLALGLNNEQIAIYTLADGAFQYQLLQKYADYLQFLPHSAILLTQEWGWNIATNQPVTTNFPGGVISADGQTVVYEAYEEAEANFQVGQLTWENGTLQFHLASQINNLADRITQLALSPDGSKFTLADWNPHIQVWDTKTGEVLYEVDLALSGNLSSGSSSKTRRFSPAKHSGPGRYFGASVAFSPDGKWLIAHNGDNDLLFWEADTGKFVQSWTDAEKNISFTADLTKALTWDGSLTEWSNTGEKLFEQPNHLPWIWDLTFLPQNNQLVLGSTDLVLLNTPQLQPQARFNGPAFRVAWLDNGETLVYSRHQEMFFHHLPTGRLTAQYHPYSSPWGIELIETSTDGQWLATRVGDELGRVWWLENWTLMLEVGDFEPTSRFLTFTPDSQYVVVAENSENAIQFWSLQPTETENTLTLHHSIPYGEDWYIGRVVTSPDNQFLLMNNFVMDLQTETVVATLPTWGDEVVFTPNGQLLLMLTDKQLQLWNTADWSLIRTIEMDKQPRDFAISADGKLLAITFYDTHLELWGIPQ